MKAYPRNERRGARDAAGPRAALPRHATLLVPALLLLCGLFAVARVAANGGATGGGAEDRKADARVASFTAGRRDMAGRAGLGRMAF